jgi:hypothetical protein
VYTVLLLSNAFFLFCIFLSLEGGVSCQVSQWNFILFSKYTTAIKPSTFQTLPNTSLMEFSELLTNIFSYASLGFAVILKNLRCVPSVQCKMHFDNVTCRDGDLITLYLILKHAENLLKTKEKAEH